jgi:hypothetical protein
MAETKSLAVRLRKEVEQTPLDGAVERLKDMRLPDEVLKVGTNVKVWQDDSGAWHGRGSSSTDSSQEFSTARIPVSVVKCALSIKVGPLTEKGCFLLSYGAPKCIADFLWQSKVAEAGSEVHVLNIDTKDQNFKIGVYYLFIFTAGVPSSFGVYTDQAASCIHVKVQRFHYVQDAKASNKILNMTLKKVDGRRRILESGVRRVHKEAPTAPRSASFTPSLMLWQSSTPEWEQSHRQAHANESISHDPAVRRPISAPPVRTGAHNISAAGMRAETSTSTRTSVTSKALGAARSHSSQGFSSAMKGTLDHGGNYERYSETHLSGKIRPARPQTGKMASDQHVKASLGHTQLDKSIGNTSVMRPASALEYREHLGDSIRRPASAMAHIASHDQVSRTASAQPLSRVELVTDHVDCAKSDHVDCAKSESKKSFMTAEEQLASMIKVRKKNPSVRQFMCMHPYTLCWPQPALC